MNNEQEISASIQDNYIKDKVWMRLKGRIKQTTFYATIPKKESATEGLQGSQMGKNN